MEILSNSKNPLTFTLLHSLLTNWGKQPNGYPGDLEATWRNFAAEVQGTFIEKRNLFGFKFAPKVILSVEPWTITYETPNVAGPGGSWTTVTSVRVPYVSNEEFTFKIFRPGLLSRLSAVTNAATGHPEFDQECIIQSHGAHESHALIGNDHIRQLAHSLLLSGNNPVLWAEEGIRPHPFHTLYYEERGTITDSARLRSILELLTGTLKHLCHMGLAYQEDPGPYPAPIDLRHPIRTLRTKLSSFFPLVSNSVANLTDITIGDQPANSELISRVIYEGQQEGYTAILHPPLPCAYTPRRFPWEPSSAQ